MTEKEINEEKETVEIFKGPVLYFISIKHEIDNSEDFFIETQPVITDLLCGYVDSINEYGEGIRIAPRQHILGIVPAPVGMFEVYIWDADGEMLILGFEYPNHEHPDWEKVAENKIAEKKIAEKKIAEKKIAEKKIAEKKEQN